MIRSRSRRQASCPRGLSDRGQSAGAGRLFLGLTVLVVAGGPALADDLPEDIWSGAHGGYPSITANTEAGVSITLPAEIVEQAGPGSLAQAAETFLDRWAPGMCSGAFDFQSPHRHLRIGVAVTQTGRQDFSNSSSTEPVAAPTYTDVTIDYEPSRKVICIVPDDPNS